MGKWYEVTITQTTVIAVEVLDHEGPSEAEDIALDQVSMDGNPTAETTTWIHPNDVERVQRHADYVVELEDE